jgi:transposase
VVLRTLLADPAIVRLVKIIPSPESLILVVEAARERAPCPSCGEQSGRIHSRYTRSVTDLPWQGSAVKIELLTRRFFCDNSQCRQRIFCERLPSVVGKYARRTTRLCEALTLIGFALSGEAGGRLTLQLGMRVSPDTLLRLVRKTALQKVPTPRVLGVDDFAFRRGRNYGTILVDLERRCPIDLLPDRESKTLTRWLRAHPGIEVVCRDRSRAYAEAISEGAPGAVQVADRWHLIKNLSEAMERLLTREHKLARDTAQLLVGEPKKEKSSPSDEPLPGPVTLLPVQPRAVVIAHRAKRIELYKEVMRLKREGVPTKKIARRVGKSPRTIYRWSQAGEFREHVKHRRSALDIHLPYITARWAEGCRNISELWRELVARGYRSSRKSLSNYLHRKILISQPTSGHRSQGAKRARRSSSSLPRPAPSPRQVVWMLLKLEGLKESQSEMIDELCRLSPEIKIAAELAQRFLRLVRERRSEELRAWMIEVEQSGVPELKAFARGLEQDCAAVDAALSQEWSSGQVEGQIHRLKLLKRQMYGRAKSDLLRAKVLLAA